MQKVLFGSRGGQAKADLCTETFLPGLLVAMTFFLEKTEAVQAKNFII